MVTRGGLKQEKLPLLAKVQESIVIWTSSVVAIAPPYCLAEFAVKLVPEPEA